MTAIVSFQTKKALKEAVAAKQDFNIMTPTPWGDKFTTSRDIVPGEAVVCTNHPKRSWFASIKRQPDGSLKVE
jgi:hypothetical protein